MKSIVSLALMVAVVAVTSGTGLAGEAKVSAELDISDAYVFRGSTFNHGAVAQLGLEVGGLPVTFGVWGNLDVDDYSKSVKSGEFSEIDLYGSYELPLALEPFGLSLGYTEYTYPSGGGDADRELSLTAALETTLSPSLGIFAGVDGGIKDSVYVELGVEYELQIAERLGCTLAGALGYLNPDEGKSGLSHADISASISHGIFNAGITYVARIDDDVLMDIEDGGTYDAKLVGKIGIAIDL